MKITITVLNGTITAVIDPSSAARVSHNWSIKSILQHQGMLAFPLSSEFHEAVKCSKIEFLKIKMGYNGHLNRRVDELRKL